MQSREGLEGKARNAAAAAEADVTLLLFQFAFGNSVNGLF